jgi:hypothetical protein
MEFLPSSPPGASGAASVCTLGRHITMSRSLPGSDRPDTKDPKAFTCMGRKGKEGYGTKKKGKQDATELEK